MFVLACFEVRFLRFINSVDNYFYTMLRNYICFKNKQASLDMINIILFCTWGDLINPINLPHDSWTYEEISCDTYV